MRNKIIFAAVMMQVMSINLFGSEKHTVRNIDSPMYKDGDVWAAYDGFNNTLLDWNKFIYKTNSSFKMLQTVIMELRRFGVNPYIGIWL